MARLVKNRKRAAVLAAILIASPLAAGCAPLNRIGRLGGCGYSDGYHACKDTGCRLCDDLPPKGFSENGKSCLKGNCNSANGAHGNFYDSVDSSHGCDAGGCDVIGCDGGCASMGCDAPGLGSASYVVGPQQIAYQQPMYQQSGYQAIVPNNAFNVIQPQVALPQPMNRIPRPQPYNINPPSPTPANPVPAISPQTQKRPVKPAIPTVVPDTKDTMDLPVPGSDVPKTPNLGTPETSDVKIGPYDVRFAPKTAATFASEVEAKKRPIRPLPPTDQRRPMRIAAPPRQDVAIQAPSYVIAPSPSTPVSIGAIQVPPPMTLREYFSSPATANSLVTTNQTRQPAIVKQPDAGKPYEVPKKKSLLPGIPNWRFIKQP